MSSWLNNTSCSFLKSSLFFKIILISEQIRSYSTFFQNLFHALGYTNIVTLLARPKLPAASFWHSFWMSQEHFQPLLCDSSTSQKSSNACSLYTWTQQFLLNLLIVVTCPVSLSAFSIDTGRFFYSKIHMQSPCMFTITQLKITIPFFNVMWNHNVWAGSLLLGLIMYSPFFLSLMHENQFIPLLSK